MKWGKEYKLSAPNENNILEKYRLVTLEYATGGQKVYSGPPCLR